MTSWSSTHSSLSEAHKLAAEILETRKRLTTIYSTHAHPDLYNIFHSNTPTTYEAVYDPPPLVRWMRPTAVLQPRFVRFNVQIDF